MAQEMGQKIRCDFSTTLKFKYLGKKNYRKVKFFEKLTLKLEKTFEDTQKCL